MQQHWAAQAPALLSESLCADPEAKSRVSVLETALQHLESSSPLLKSISPAELLDRADFPDSTLFAITNYQLWKIPREGTEQAFRAIRVFLAVMLLFGSLLRARL